MKTILKREVSVYGNDLRKANQIQEYERMNE
jgi:hypothetical protein